MTLQRLKDHFCETPSTPDPQGTYRWECPECGTTWRGEPHKHWPVPGQASVLETKWKVTAHGHSIWEDVT